MLPHPATPQYSGEYPMQSRNGAIQGGFEQTQFAGPTPFRTDYDFTQRLFRRYENASNYLAVQLPSGLEQHKFQGKRYPYRGAGWLWGFATPIVPNQTRSMSGPYGGGLTPKGASNSQIQTLWNATVGQMPTNPAGYGPPGQFYGDFYDLPGTG